jgi:hypothetical protein
MERIMLDTPCRVSADLNRHEEAGEASEKRYQSIASNYDNYDIAAEICVRFPEKATEIIAQAIGRGDSTAKSIGNLSLDLAVKEQMAKGEY